MRIAVGGIAVECCTFSPLLTQMEDLSITRGNALLELYPFLNQYSDITFVPLVRARATPGGPIVSDVYAAIKNEFMQGLRRGMPWDGVYLDLHGAMSVVGMQDAEGDFIAAVREIVGHNCLIAASYDLHGNVSPRVVQHLDILTAYRTAPHIDVDETRARAVHLLVNCLKRGMHPILAFVRIPMLLPGEQAMTSVEPARSLYANLPDVIAQFGLLDASLLVGYAWADEARTGASAVTVGEDMTLVHEAAQHLASIWWNQRANFKFGVRTCSVDKCISQALSAAMRQTPVFISDAGDNITGGGIGDVPFLLERMLWAGVKNAVYAPLVDPQSVTACFRAGLGAEVTLHLGGKLDTQHDSPLHVRGRILRLSPHETGNRQVVLQVEGIKVILTERRTAFTTVAQFETLGIRLTEYDIIAVKLGYLFPELASIAKQAFLAISPGVINPAVEALEYLHLARPIFPLDVAMQWKPQAFGRIVQSAR